MQLLDLDDFTVYCICLRVPAHAPQLRCQSGAGALHELMPMLWPRQHQLLLHNFLQYLNCLFMAP